MRGGVLLALCVVAWMSWTEYSKDRWDTSLSSGNGRIEAVEIDIASKAAGRLKDVLVREGDFVSAGQVVALMDTEVLDAQLRQAEAQLQQAQIGVTVARSQWHQRQAEKTAMLAVQAQREAE
ncbi:MAG: biotin/lipoyl-binding protein, partial [Halothiobacillaceae bacterium]